MSWQAPEEGVSDPARRSAPKEGVAVWLAVGGEAAPLLGPRSRLVSDLPGPRTPLVRRLITALSSSSLRWQLGATLSAQEGCSSPTGR